MKDGGIGPLTDRMPSLQRVLRSISRRLESDDEVVVFLCGDLACQGDTREYDGVVKWLVDSLHLGAHALDHLHVVPGNHDVDRRLCTARTKLNPKKFAPLIGSWKSAVGEILATDSVRTTDVGPDEGGLRVFSLNSCIGCGEWRLFPKPVRKELAAAIEAYRKSDRDKAFKLEGEKLDTPMFDEEHITELQEQLSECAINRVPFVLAHHNLLQQELERVGLYTDLLNGGPLRTMLARLGRPVIYCHGHIHDDPIETVADIKQQGSQLVCISAPELVHGFNEIKIQFSRAGEPLGICIYLHRLEANGVVSLRTTHKVRFLNTANRIPEDITYLQRALPTGTQRFLAIKQAYEQASKSTLDEEEFEDLIIEAGWLGILSIDDETAPAKYWTVRRKSA